MADELTSPRGQYLLRFFDSKMKNADKVEKYRKDDFDITVAFTRESMGYKSGYKPVPTMYVKLEKDNLIEIKRFTGKNIDKYIKKIREISERVY